MKWTYTILAFLFILSVQDFTLAQTSTKQLLIKPFKNKVFIKEQGQFWQNSKERKAVFTEPILFGIENGEFNAYFTSKGIIFQFLETKSIDTKEDDQENAEERNEKRTIETIWHTVHMFWVNTNPSVEVIPEEKVSEYYNYGGFEDKTTYNFVPAYRKLKYVNLYPGVDVEFELPLEGGIKYRFFVKPNIIIPSIAFQFEGAEKIYTDENGDLHFESLAGHLFDKAPNAYTASTLTNIPVKYNVSGNTVQFQFSVGEIASSEGIVIDPWIVNPGYAPTNRAFDIQEDSLGNVFVHGNTTNYNVQKYNSSGVLQWTYVTSSIFLGDIAVDNPGNVYIIGGYSAGKRQKLDPSGVQQWVFSGLQEEWRLSFNYSKTVLAVGGYFLNPLGNNLGKFDMNTGAISNQIIYNLETRAIATDCNGDIYSLHVTFGTVGTAAGNVLNKTNANFTPAGSMGSGLLLPECEPATGYAPNPTYSSCIYHGINGIIVFGPYVYIYDGSTLRRINKTALAIINSVAVPGGTYMQCSGLATDPCGNVYAGTINGIVQFDSTLNYLATIPTPGAVYDIILAANGELLACGEGFLGSFSIVCTSPALLNASATSINGNCGLGGSATITAIGATAPYTYTWQPGGQITATATNLASGVYTYTVNDAFCQTFQDTIIVNQTPLLTVNSNLFINTSGFLSNPSCFGYIDGSAIATISGGSGPYVYSWNTTPIQVTDTASGLLAGTYIVTVTDADNCIKNDTIILIEPALLTANLSSQTDVSCFGGNDGSVTISAAGGTAPYNFSWNTVPIQTSNTATNLYAGGYTCTITDAHACTTTFSVIISQSTQVVGGVIPPVTVCNGDNVAATAFTSIPLGGTFTWTNSDPTIGIGANGTGDILSFIANNVSSLPIIATITVSPTVNGCIGIPSIYTITVNPTPTVVVPPNIIVCNGDNILATTFTSPSTGATFTWTNSDPSIGIATNGTGNIPSFITTNIGLSVITSTITVTPSANGCIGIPSTYTITVNPSPTVLFSANPTLGCLPLCVDFSDLSTVVGSSITTWMWNIEGQSTSINKDETFCFNTPGLYDASLTVTSSVGCSSTMSFVDYIDVRPAPIADFLYLPTQIFETDPTVIFTNTSLGAISYLWNFGDGGSSTLLSPPAYTYSDTGTYCVFLQVLNNIGCMDSITHCLQITPEFLIYIPNSFTPNGDKNNEIFRIYGRGIKDLDARIFNRWGEEIYYFDDVNEGWPGTRQNGGICQMGVYVYQVTVITLMGNELNFRGQINLLR